MKISKQIEVIVDGNIELAVYTLQRRFRTAVRWISCGYLDVRISLHPANKSQRPRQCHTGNPQLDRTSDAEPQRRPSDTDGHDR